MKKWNLRVITNLHCNERCYFCYQKNKQELILNKDELKSLLENNIIKMCERGAIYGGEPTLLDDLNKYIAISKPFCKVLSMTTNGTILTKEKMIGYTEAGLDEMGIFIPSIKYWNEMRKSSFEDMEKTILLAKECIKNLRINIVENIYNMNKEDSEYEIYDMIRYFICELEVGILICRNFSQRFPDLDLEGKLGLVKDGDLRNGVQQYMYNGKIMLSYYAPLKVYDRNDWIISPLGEFYTWSGFIKASKKSME